MDYGLKVALPGFSINSTEPREYAYNSAYGTVKIYSKVSGSLTIGASSNNTVDINHGLPFIPLVIFWCELKPGSSRWFLGGAKYSPGDADAGDCYPDVDTYVDSTKFRLDLRNDGASSKTVSYICVFLGDTAQV